MEVGSNGILIDRITENTKTTWYWGDWGVNADKKLLINAWYFLALKGYHLMASALGDQNEVSWSKEAMVDFKEAFNQFFGTVTVINPRIIWLRQTTVPRPWQ